MPQGQTTKSKRAMDMRTWRAKKLVNDPDYFRKRYNSDYHKWRHLWQKFKISRGDFRAMLFMQGGKCAICGSPNDIVVDHDHKNGKFRGLLCRTCNTGIGSLKDNPEMLRRAIEYLESETEPGVILNKTDNTIQQLKTFA